MNTAGEDLAFTVLFAVLGLALLFFVIHFAVLSAIRASRKPTRAERKRSAS